MAWWLASGLLVAVLLAWPSLHPQLRGAALWLYQQGSGLNALVATPLNSLRLTTTVPLLAPLLLGLMAATAPCQLSTGAAALAYVSRDSRSPLASAGAYLGARVVFYAVVGAFVMYALGGQFEAPGPVLLGVRKVLGPLTLIIGLVLLGWLRPRFEFGARLSARLENRARTLPGNGGAFALGLAFSFAFCPTLFLLFFGLTVPLALTSSLGFLYPAVFALGMTLPLLGFAAFLPGGNAQGQGRYLRAVRTWRRLATPIAGGVFLLAGLYDTFVYWLL
ncbi:cytochrome c biogenesis protein (plasmid) [Deinococcus peraridilitoris DSM 19664]|uniref:Cytochrome c biogenesis protein n=1 Tax=Deinococcus peraridilitoris (strain DSM 19664 / LMG 22246 / CIP 109416 / KR-200) TaxID=937777 RepID=L0A9K0_DEIPD|nr:cytochrome c biogenesis protein [Deinococcus peraridilitoris DSM 19664]